jgi:hypothetical protein
VCVSFLIYLSPDELTLNAGTKVGILEKYVDGWWRVCIINGTEMGLYPSNYLIEEVDEV